MPPAPNATLPKIVGAYKAGVTRIARQETILDDDAIIWQRSYHDHIIQNEHTLGKLRHYIEVNPARWDVDTLHPDKRQQ
jgi:putative transposase